MLIPVVSWVAVGASLALFQTAEAAPIRITVVTHQEWSGSTTGVGGMDPSVVRVGHMHMPIHAVEAPPGPKKAGCHMRPGKGPKVSLSDTLRKALGLPPVEHHHHPHHAHVDPVVIPAPIFVEPGRVFDKPQVPVESKSTEEPFLRRVHAALLELGTWEARAVAFVLGCGIGVLLRMIWVFVVLIFRGLREEESDAADAEYTLVFEHVDEALPPKYNDDAAPAYVDEKTKPAPGA